MSKNTFLNIIRQMFFMNEEREISSIHITGKWMVGTKQG